MLCRAILLLTLLLPGLAAAQTHARREPEPPPAKGPPHAWLFGTWTGGLFPVLDGQLAQDCRMQPTVAFAQDVMEHASLTGSDLTRRIIETVRTSPEGAEFRFTPDPADAAGFGCDDPNELHVARENNTTISFPGCAAFPYPLERCPVA